MRDQIISGMYNFPSPYWDSVSPEAIDLVSRMMQVDPKNRITVDQALAHPWLKARRTKGGWTIDGLNFVVADPDITEDSQRTQSISAESSQLNSASRLSRGALSPLSPALQNRHHFQPQRNAPLPPSSPPFANVDVQDSEIIFASASVSDSEAQVCEYTTAIGVSASAEAEVVDASNRKRKDPSFMRSQSDLGDMALPKRAMHTVCQPDLPMCYGKQTHDSMNSLPAQASDNSGPLALFEMSPDMNFQPVHGNKHAKFSSGSSGHSSTHGGKFQRPVNEIASGAYPMLIYPKPLPRPGAPDMELSSFHVPSAANKPFGMNGMGAHDDTNAGKQLTVRKPLPTFFDFTRRP
ncbi:serine/threonine protein kinase [Coemansia sp. RSA 530]|nr:serine/threonine protein kinase [Coemansia sp. RSA 530]